MIKPWPRSSDSSDPDLWPSEAFGPRSSLDQGFFLAWVLFCTSRLPAFQRALCMKGKSNDPLLFFESKAEAVETEAV